MCKFHDPSIIGSRDTEGGSDDNDHCHREYVKGINNRFEFHPTDSGQVLKLLNKLNKSKGLVSINYQVGLFVNVPTLFRHISRLFLIVV